MKKSYLRAVAILVCVAFLASMAPALQSAEKKATKTSVLASLKDSFRVLAYIFPLFSPLVELNKEDVRNKELGDRGSGSNLIVKPTSDSPSPGEPRIKD